MKEVQEIIQSKIQSMVDDGSMQKVIEDQVAQSVISSLKNQFASFGKISRDLEKLLEAGLNLNVKDLPFETYNAQMLVIIKQRIAQFFQGEAAERLLAELDEALAPAPVEMSINELVETIAAFWKTAEPWDPPSDIAEEATVELKNERDATYSLNMWKKRETSYGSSRGSDIALYIIEGKIRISHRMAFNPTCLYEADAFIFKLYAGGTTITGLENFDPDECDLFLIEEA